MQMVWRAVMHDVQIRMRQQFFHIPVSVRNIQRQRLFLRLLERAVAQRDDLHKAESSQRLNMRRADETAADNPDVNHENLLQQSRQMPAPTLE
ncbi:hypothetical protein D3C78_1722860 [compost metagenome]